MSDDRLYGEPGDEYLHNDPDDVVQRRLEWLLPKDFPHTMTVEEQTVRPRRSHFPDAEWVLDEILDRTSDNGEIDENFDARMRTRAADPEVVAAFEAAIELLASKVNYRMADEVVMIHTIVVTSPESWEITESAKP